MSMGKVLKSLFVILAFSFPMQAFCQETALTFRDNTYDLSQEGAEKDLGIFGKIKVKSSEEKRYLSDIRSQIYVADFFNSQKMLKENSDDIRFVSEQVPLSWREEAYRQNHMEYHFMDFLWQTFTIGFGLGNFIQSDFIAGPVFLVSDVMAWLMPVLGMNEVLKNDAAASQLMGVVLLFPITLLVDIFVFPLSGGKASLTGLIISGGNPDNDLLAKTMGPYIALGIAIKACSMIGSTVCAAIRAKNYNRSLTYALALDTGVTSINFVPLLDPVDMKYGLAINIKF